MTTLVNRSQLAIIPAQDFDWRHDSIILRTVPASNPRKLSTRLAVRSRFQLCEHLFSLMDQAYFVRTVMFYVMVIADTHVLARDLDSGDQRRDAGIPKQPF